MIGTSSPIKRSILPENGLWFAPGLPETGEIDPFKTEAGDNSDRRARKDLKEWLEKESLPYYSPHKFRHGHAVYALKQADNISELKAVSQNLMHATISTTDGIYGILSGNDIRENIMKLSKNFGINENSDMQELIYLTKRVLGKLEMSKKKYR